eukprot:GHVT01064889.1.p1 GENE.GHVT01064889.1~~GHVT01064889.1.p1  ORF type:complete len:296 (+),score=36.55 GHVT01064889.1:897-1784(+)
MPRDRNQGDGVGGHAPMEYGLPGYRVEGSPLRFALGGVLVYHELCTMVFEGCSHPIARVISKGTHDASQELACRLDLDAEKSSVGGAAAFADCSSTVGDRDARTAGDCPGQIEPESVTPTSITLSGSASADVGLRALSSADLPGEAARSCVKPMTVCPVSAYACPCSRPVHSNSPAVAAEIDDSPFPDGAAGCAVAAQGADGGAETSKVVERVAWPPASAGAIDVDFQDALPAEMRSCSGRAPPLALPNHPSPFVDSKYGRQRANKQPPIAVLQVPVDSLVFDSRFESGLVRRVL